MTKIQSLLWCAIALAPWQAAFGFNLSAELAKAKPGAVVELPAGTYSGGYAVPAGVTLRGAGYQKTTIDARNSQIGIRVKGSAVRIENLTILNTGTGIELSDVDNVIVSRVMILGGTIGIGVTHVAKATIENTIVARALIGISLNGPTDSSVANCTIATANACGITVSSATDTAIFNNIVVDAGTGIVVGGENNKLAVDHNLYVALSTGKIEGQLQRPTLPTWRDVSGGLDAHSVQLNVAFANASQNDFHPVSKLSWNPSRISTADWGTAELAGHRAPPTDMDGQPRIGAVDLGAFEAPPLAARPADGQFQIASDAGYKSAGLFGSDNRAVCYLFQGLPLKKGSYSYVVPSRDMFGRPIPAGNYELRVVESTVAWDYRGMTANAGADNTATNADSVHIGLVTYAGDGQLLTASGWSERHINLRLSDPATAKARWIFEGSADSTGLCTDAAGKIYLVRNGADHSVDIYKLDPISGLPIPRPDGRLYVNLKGKFKSKYLGGIAELDGKLFAADQDADKVDFGSADDLQFQASADILKPHSPAADRKHKLIWLVSNREKIIAISADGKPVVQFSDVQMPLALSVAGDRLAVASGHTGKIHIFDISDPQRPKAVKTLGRGDGPFGKWLPDRFHFQAHPWNRNGANVSLALNVDGSVALRDSSSRLVTFGPDGNVLHDGFAVWGGDPTIAPFAGDTNVRAFDSSGVASYFIDPRTGKWQPDAYWGLPEMIQPTIRGFFSAAGKNFGVFTCQNPVKNGGEQVMIVSYDNPVVRAVALYKRNPKGGWLCLRDTNGDGVIDDKDGPGQTVLDTAGKPVKDSLTGRFFYVEHDGTIIHSEPQIALRWKFKGIGDRGEPQYEFGPDRVFTAKDPVIPSPYFLDQTDDLRCASSARMSPDGGICSGINLRHTPNGTGLSNSGATDLARWNPDGNLRWLRTVNDYSPIQGVEPFPGVTISSWGHQAEFMALDDDGLELARFGFPAAVHWSGFWVDHPSEWDAVKDPDGNVEILIGDYMQNCHHWMTVRNLSAVKKSSYPLTINAAKTREMAYRPPQLHESVGKSKSPEITIKKLPGPLTIDGNMQKWRSFPPQILMTPQTAVGRIDGPADCSGVIRLAYHDHDLYGQAIVFDNVVSFHQPASRFYQQDSLQFCINGFLPGFAFNITQTIDKGPILFRNRFFFGAMDLELDPKLAPRIVKKFANAKDIPERQYIESIYGVDLSNSPGYVMEFKLPLDANTYKGDEKIIPQVESGKWFWLGFMLNDNDVPGTDVQRYIAWPATFGMFSPAEAGAKAFFE